MDTSGWHVEEIAERANIIIETLNEPGSFEGMMPTLINDQEELASDLNDARLILEQYDELLMNMPGHGAIKGFMVRGALKRINPILERTLQLRSARADLERSS